MGFENEADQSFERPCRHTDGRSKRTYDLTSSIVPRGTSFHRAVGLVFSPIDCDLALSCSRSLLPAPVKLAAVNPDAVSRLAFAPMAARRRGTSGQDSVG